MADNILDTIRGHCTERADQLAYWTPTREWTFGQIGALSNRIAQGLKSLGVGHGDRVTCLTKHTAQGVALVLAANKIGAVCMPVNWRLAAPEIEYIVNNGEARFMMMDAEFVPMFQTVKAPTIKGEVCTDVGTEGVVSIADWAARFSDEDPGYSPAPTDTALQLYSSGTTGLPKGVELSHGNLSTWMLGAGASTIGYAGGSHVMLSVLPTFHIAGVGVGLLTAVWGGKNVLYPEFNPPLVLKAIEQHRVTHSFMVPAMIQFLLMVPDVAKTDFSSLHTISYGASPITEKVLIDAMRTFGCKFVQVYGLTETTGAITALPAEDHDPDGPKKHLLRSAGKAMRGVEIGVFDVATGKRLPDGEVGEVWIRSGQNMKGYWANPRATEDVLVGRTADSPGWFRSGDAGYMQGEYLFLHDRIKDMIVSGGENIYPAEVENVLMKHPSVADGAVIGVPDDQWGEAVKAVVVLKPGTTAEAADIIAFMRERLGHFKCPKTVDFVQAIPRNPSGKILKRVLREPYWVGKTRRVN